MISNKDEISMFGMMGVGKIPITGGPSSALRSTIGQTIPLEACTQSTVTPSSGVMDLTAIFLTAGNIINNINYISSVTAESGGTHLWFAIYDDGRGSPTAGQLALLGQTLDQTGAAAFGASTNLGLSLMVPFVTTYSGIYYVAFMCTATVTPLLIASPSNSTATIQIGSVAGATYAMTAGSGLTNMAPNPSGALSTSSRLEYAYVS